MSKKSHRQSSKIKRSVDLKAPFTVKEPYEAKNFIRQASKKSETTVSCIRAEKKFT